MSTPSTEASAPGSRVGGIDRGKPPVDRAHSSRWVRVFWSSWLVSAVICGALLFTPGYESDVLHYKYWARNLSLNGIETAYSGKNTRDYVMYPPVFVYVYDAIGVGYARWVDPRFDIERMKRSEALTAAIKGVSVAAHLALGAALFLLIRRLHSEKWAAIAASVYLLNPTVIFDVAAWGAPDGFHSLGVVAAYGLGELGLWAPAWLAMALAAASKPQAWILMPLFSLRQMRVGGPIRLLTGGLIAGLTCVLLILPFLASQRLSELLTLPAAITNYMPFVSANAHNLWWLVVGGQPILDREPWVGPITYEQASMGLVLMLTLGVMRRSLGARPGAIFMLAAYQAFGWYCLTTQLHENHSFFVLPLLALALPFDRWAWTPMLAVSITLLLNMVLHDPAFTSMLSPGLLHPLTLCNALANIALLGIWTWRLFALRSAAQGIVELIPGALRAGRGFGLKPNP